ncbi:hypothetical protein BY996DRAFT_6413299 [Phakopsora pachyrhizi]|nr:hypothetical protein BY996DRAFT_6413299 [Phakopsora pachyrhizi]
MGYSNKTSKFNLLLYFLWINLILLEVSTMSLLNDYYDHFIVGFNEEAHALEFEGFKEIFELQRVYKKLSNRVKDIPDVNKNKQFTELKVGLGELIRSLGKLHLSIGEPLPDSYFSDLNINDHTLYERLKLWFQENKSSEILKTYMRGNSFEITQNLARYSKIISNFRSLGFSMEELHGTCEIIFLVANYLIGLEDIKDNLIFFLLKSEDFIKVLATYSRSKINNSPLLKPTLFPSYKLKIIHSIEDSWKNNIFKHLSPKQWDLLISEYITQDPGIAEALMNVTKDYQKYRGTFEELRNLNKLLSLKERNESRKRIMRSLIEILTTKIIESKSEISQVELKDENYYLTIYHVLEFLFSIGDPNDNRNLINLNQFIFLRLLLSEDYKIKNNTIKSSKDIEELKITFKNLCSSSSKVLGENTPIQKLAFALENV